MEASGFGNLLEALLSNSTSRESAAGKSATAESADRSAPSDVAVSHRAVDYSESTYPEIVYPESGTSESGSQESGSQESGSREAASSNVFSSKSGAAETNDNDVIDTAIAAGSFNTLTAALQAAGQAQSPAAKAQQLATAASLYRGELLPGCHDDWILQERQWLAESYFQALSQLLEHLEQAPSFVALKTIIAYRSGLAVSEPEPGELAACFRRVRSEGGDPPRLTSRPLLNYLLLRALEWAAERGVPVQFHSGYGDRDLDLLRASPTHLRPVLESARLSSLKVVLLHASYPYTREASYLASVYPNVYVDWSEANPMLTPVMLKQVLEELLAQAPYTRLLYGSDAWGVPDWLWLGARVGRTALAAALAQQRQAPRLTMVIEGGIIGPRIKPGRLPISTNEMRAAHRATMLPGITDTFLFARRGFLDDGFMGGAPIDHSLASAAYLGLCVLVLLVGAGTAAFAADTVPAVLTSPVELMPPAPTLAVKADNVAGVVRLPATLRFPESLSVEIVPPALFRRLRTPFSTWRYLFGVVVPLPSNIICAPADELWPLTTRALDEDVLVTVTGCVKSFELVQVLLPASGPYATLETPVIRPSPLTVTVAPA